MVYHLFTNKTKKIQYTILKISTKKNRNFHNGFFVKSYHLNLNFFQALQSALLKNEKKKSSRKRYKSAKNCLTIDIVRERSKTLKKKKEKRKMRKIQTIAFLLLLFYVGKFIFR